MLGGHRAVGLMATHDNPIQTTNSIAFTIDTIDDTFALTAFTLIGAGMLSFPIAALQRRPSRRVWPGYTIIVGVRDVGHRRLLRSRQRQILRPDAVHLRCGGAAALAGLDRPQQRILLRPSTDTVG